MKTRFTSVVLVFFALAYLEGCVTSVTTYRKAAFTTLITRQAGVTPEQEKARESNCVHGCPIVSASAGYGPTARIYRKGYVLQHSSLDRIPIWVSEHVVKDQLTGDLTRIDSFAPEPLLPAGSRAELEDYRRSGFDRGHQAPAGNQTKDAPLKAETFFLSNICPKMGALNQQKWRQLEEKTREWVSRLGDAYEITGPIFYEPKEDDPATANGIVKFKQIGRNKVSVPTHFFKVVVAKEGGKLKAIGFVMENRGYASRRCSIGWNRSSSRCSMKPTSDTGEGDRQRTPCAECGRRYRAVGSGSWTRI